MKNSIKFLSIYIVIVALTASYFYKLYDEDSRKLALTKSKLSGVEYIQVIHHLGLDVIHLRSMMIHKSDDEAALMELREDVQSDIDVIHTLQQQYPSFSNDTLNGYFQDIKKLYSDEVFYTFIDLLNQENYRIGDRSKLLFEEDRDLYFLASLLTHYMPEYIVSILLSESILDEFYTLKTLSKEKQIIYIEQSKLVALSAQEVGDIISLLSKKAEFNALRDSMQRVAAEVEKFSALKEHLNLEQYNATLLQEYLDILRAIQEQTLSLNDLYIATLTSMLQERKEQLIEQIYNDTLMFSFYSLQSP